MDSSGNNFVYLAAVYDYGPAGDLENGGIKYPISLSVPVQKRECTENDLTYGDNVPENDRSSACFKLYPDGSKPRCDLTTFKCGSPAACQNNAVPS